LGAFGEKLRKQREQRGLALDAISNVTKISTRMLRALEDEQFGQLPGGVFNKGFVRAYARQVGLDEEETVSEYLAALRESQIQQQSILPDFRASAGKPTRAATPELRSHDLHSKDLPSHDVRNQDLRSQDLRSKDLRSKDLPGNDDHNDNELRPADRRKQGRRNEDRRHQDLPWLPDSAGSPAQPANADDSSTRIPWGKLAVALLLVTLALAFWNFRRHSGAAGEARSVAASNASPTSAPAQSPSPFSPSVSAAPKPARSAGSLAVGKPSPAGTSPPTPARASTVLPGAPTPASTTASSTGAASIASKPAANPPAAGLVANASTSATAAAPPTTFTLLVRAEKTTWISILADGKPVAEETLIAPAHTSARASGEIVVKAGNAAGVSFLLNGKEIPAQGHEGEVKTYVFDATGFRVLPPPQSPATNR